MGSFLARLTDYPLKISHHYVHTLDDPQPGHTDANQGKGLKSYYDKVVNDFNKQLLYRRAQNRTKSDGISWEKKNLLINFPDWNESTISYLHSLYLTFLNENNKMIDFKAFSCILICLWSDADAETKRKRFNLMDTNQDGFLDYLEYLELIYHFDNLAISTKKMTEQIQYISTLSIGEQLEHGLF